MYEIGDLIVYAGEGVCRVEEIGVPPMTGINKQRQYYTLKPLYRAGMVYAPVDTQVFMRPVITREDADALIDRIPEIEPVVYENSNLRFLNEYYQAQLQNYNCEGLIKLIRSTRAKREVMIGRGKKLGLVDERYMKRAQDMLHGEFAVALGIERNEVPGYIESKLGALQPA
ncbi:MAG: CarD family transcriptional regulator [Oscillospiraceae bacterium]|nr:CarD family transcriptional regulator [Oscillospiraceae bacterium]MBQ6403167.1 CarD family transcriptional regulator [Oscillospiraceae bacterium]